MKEKINKIVILSTRGVLAATLTACLTACGGGNSNSANRVNLSAAQQAYESVVLAQNGGEHFLEGALVLSSSASGTTLSSRSNFYTVDTSLPQSPTIVSPQTLITGSTSLSKTLALPTTAVVRYVVNGSIYEEATPRFIHTSYAGNNIQEIDLAPDGKTALMTRVNTANTVVQLSGAISASPDELFDDSSLGLIRSTLNGTALYDKQAVWQTGSAYMKEVRNIVGDTLTTGNCVSSTTTASNVTPCSTTMSTLESFFPFTNGDITYKLTDGQIQTVAGVRAWVGNTARANEPTVEYPVFYQYNGGIYEGSLLKDGTTLQLNVAGTSSPQNFYIFLNGPAMASVKAAVTF